MKLLNLTSPIFLAFVLFACTASKQPNTSTNFTSFKVKSFPFWQVKKQLTGGNYQISNIQRSITKTQDVSIGVLDNTYSRSKGNFSISFQTTNGTQSATTHLHNNFKDSELSIFEEYIGFPLKGGDVLKGDITLNNQKNASFVIKNTYSGLRVSSNGVLLVDGNAYTIKGKPLSKTGFTYEISKGDTVIATADAHGNFSLLTSDSTDAALTKFSALTALVFGSLNRN